MQTRTISTCIIHASKLNFSFLYGLVELAARQQIAARAYRPMDMTVRFWAKCDNGIINMEAEAC